MFAQGWITYCFNGQKQKKQISFEELPFGDEEIEIKVKESNAYRGKIYQITLHPLGTVELIDFAVKLSREIENEESMMVNGFQSESLSKEISRHDFIKPLFVLARPFLASRGDYKIFPSSGKKGRFHSWTYTYFCGGKNAFRLFGSINEKPGYTVWEYFIKERKLLVHRECQGAKATQEYPLLEIYEGKGDRKGVFNEYFSFWPSLRGNGNTRLGWSSSHNCRTGISEKVVEENLQALSHKDVPIQVFQVEDGYQEAYGDWVYPHENFPSGMPALAEKISSHGFLPGLWLAPFICEKKSMMFKENSQWLLYHKGGKPVKAGWKSFQTGWLYALDFYAPGFKEHLAKLLYTVTEEWGFKILILDYLYATSLLPRNGKTRAQIMSDVVDFINNLLPETSLVARKTPLGAVIGKTDYAQVSSDTTPYWENRFLKSIHFRERPSTLNALRSTLGRYHLDGKAFRNATSNFMLSEGSTSSVTNLMNEHQRYTLFFFNFLLGGQVLFSDNIAEYTPRQQEIFRSAFPVREPDIKDFYRQGEFWVIHFKVMRRNYLALCNLEGKPVKYRLGEGMFYNSRLFMMQGKSEIELAPFETICLLEVAKSEQRPYLLGATNHIYPGAQIERLIIRRDSLTLKVPPQASRDTVVYFGIPPGQVTLRVNRVNYPVVKREEIRYVAVEPEVEE